MITRNLADIYPVSALVPLTLTSCTVTGFTSACGSNNMSGFGNGAISGYVIDRQGLPANFTAVKVGIHGIAAIQASCTSCRFQYISLGVGLQDAACSTAGWADYSTGSWVTCQAGWYKSTSTSTSDGFYNTTVKKAYGVLTCAAATSTSTGTAEVRASAVFDLTGAQRYVRCVIAPRIEATGCGGSWMTLAGELSFGHADNSAWTYGSGLAGPVIISTGNSTSTTT